MYYGDVVNKLVPSQGGNIIFSSIPPVGPATGSMWFDTASQFLFVYDGTNWQKATPFQSAMEFMGTADLASPDPFSGTHRKGQTYVVKQNATADISWTGIAGMAAKGGDIIIWDGSKFDIVASGMDLAGYVQKIGDDMTAGDAVSLRFHPAKTDGTVPVLDLGMGALNNGYLNGGRF